MAQRADSLSVSRILQNKAVKIMGRYGFMILMALLLFAAILLITGKNPLISYRDLLKATFGSAYGFSEVIVAMIPILLTALAVALPSRMGMINVGGEGQLFLGAIFATFAALTFPGLPAWILLPIMVLLGFLGGALWAFLPAYFRSIGLVNETITTLADEFDRTQNCRVVDIRLLALSPRDKHDVQFCRGCPFAHIFWYQDPFGFGLWSCIVGNFLVRHEAYALGLGNPLHRRQFSGCKGEWGAHRSIHDHRFLHKRRDRWTGRYGTGFGLLWIAHPQFFAWLWFYGISH